MTSPNLQAFASALRAPGYKRRVYFAKFDPSVVFTCTVDSTPLDGALNLTVTAVSGSAANVYRGFLVWVETSGGAYRGTTNVRAAGTISATNLPIHELAPADIAIVATDVIKVYNIPYLGDKLPRANTTFAPDDLTYSDQGTAEPPRVNSGGHWIGFVDNYWSGTVQLYATVPMPGVSTAEDPDSGGTITHLWTLLTASLTFAPGSVSTDANPTLRATQGYGIALHTVTDSSNSKAWSQFVCTQVYDATHLPYRLIGASLTGEELNGWSADNVELYQNATLTALPDGWLCGLFVVETINGSYVSYGNAYSGRSHIKLIGFLYRDENELTPQINRVRFGIRGALAQLASLPGWSKVLMRDGEGWSLLDDLTVRLVIVHLLRYYSFYMEMFDLVFDSFPAVVYPATFFQPKSVLDQLRESADGVDCRITNTRTGELMAHPRPELVALADRAAVTVTWVMTREDYSRVNLSREHWKTTQLLEARGFTSATTNANALPILSRYPSLTPGRGSQSQAIERLIATDQTDLNARCGRRGARLDGTMMDANGTYRRAVEWGGDFPSSSALDVFDFYYAYVTTSDFDATSNLRGLNLTLDNYYLTGVSVNYRANGAAEIAPTWVTATNAPAAATWLPPVTPGETPYYPPPIPSLPIPSLPAHLNNLAAINTDNYVYLTYSLGSASPVWTRAAIPGLSGTVTDSVQSAFVLSRQIVTTTAAAGIYTVDNIGGTMTTTLRKTLSAGIGAGEGRYVDASFGANFIVVKSFYIATGTWWCYSLDGGLTWSAETQITAFSATSQPSGLFVSSRAPGTAVLNAFSAANTGALYNLSGAFSAFAAAGIAATLFPGAITKAWADNENTLFFSTVNGGGTGAAIYRKIGGGATVDVTPVLLGQSIYAPNNRSLHVAPTDAKTVLVGGYAPSIPGYRIVMSRDQGASWTELDGLGAGYDGAEVAGNDRDFGYLWGTSGAIATANLAAGTVTNRSGNLASFTPGRFVRIRGI